MIFTIIPFFPFFSSSLLQFIKIVSHSSLKNILHRDILEYGTKKMRSRFVLPRERKRQREIRKTAWTEWTFGKALRERKREGGSRRRAHLARKSREFIGRERAVGPTSRAATRRVYVNARERYYMRYTPRATILQPIKLRLIGYYAGISPCDGVNWKSQRMLSFLWEIPAPPFLASPRKLGCSPYSRKY